MASVPVGHWAALPDGRLQCNVCPRHCRLADGQRGLCFVRGRVGETMMLHTWGQSSGFCLDPIEKKPLNHFLPGTSVLSFGTAGCNLACRFCQNWDISKSRETDRLTETASPAAIAATARRHQAASVAFTYNDPVIFYEYAIAVAEACHAVGVRSVAVTAGYMCPAPRAEFYRHMDAANVDLKGFTPEFYQKVCLGELAPVLDTLKYIHHETRCWLEITTLLIPGLNDGDDELRQLCDWVASELSPEVPLHFTAFHPDYKLRDRPPTPPATLTRARELAHQRGLRFVYTGNVHDPAGGSTACAHCGKVLIVRDWYQLRDWQLRDDGTCRRCHTALPGVFDGPPGTWGARRQPVSISQ